MSLKMATPAGRPGREVLEVPLFTINLIEL